ncbi:hypothetical protein KJ567_03565 [Candidatus Bipolaricaulota bacterium]|nr:hypothetical protein [Candidatus Bipolaricaulota bacterium]
MNEPVDALVIYRRGAPHPLLRAFRWRHRRYDVTETHLVHREREGETVHRIYSVSCNGETYVLRLDSDRAQWTLESLDTANSSKEQAE